MLLAVDTSTQTMGIALYSESIVVGEMLWQTSTHHTVELAPAVRQMLTRCTVKPTDLQALAVAIGPGSFTSLRIGLALVKGMALALHIPVIGVPTFDFLVQAQPPSDHPLLAVIPAGRTRSAVQWYEYDEQRWVSTTEPRVMTAEEISENIDGPTHILGEMSAEDRRIIGRKWKNAMVASPAFCTRRPSLLAELAWGKWKSGTVDDPVSLSPIYLHIAGAIQE